jgi:hypothetical protein
VIQEKLAEKDTDLKAVLCHHGICPTGLVPTLTANICIDVSIAPETMQGSCFAGWHPAVAVMHLWTPILSKFMSHGQTVKEP